MYVVPFDVIEASQMCIVLYAKERWYLRLYILANGISNDKTKMMFVAWLDPTVCLRNETY